MVVVVQVHPGTEHHRSVLVEQPNASTPAEALDMCLAALMGVGYSADALLDVMVATVASQGEPEDEDDDEEDGTTELDA